MQLLSLQDLRYEQFQLLSPQLRRAARYVIEHPGEIATRSQRHVATASNLPPPTFTRLSRAIGLQNYDQLRELCRYDILQSKTELTNRAKALLEETREGPKRQSLIARQSAAAIANLHTFFKQTPSGHLEEAARLLKGAKHVVLIGEMSARGLMDYTSYIANISLSGWKVLGRSGESLASELATLSPEDVCIAGSIKPYSNRSVETTKHVTKCGVPVIAITDNILSPLAALARIKFFVGTESPQFFPSHLSMMFVLETLIDMVIRKGGTEVQNHIAAVERQNHKLNEYWQEEPAINNGE